MENSLHQLFITMDEFFVTMEQSREEAISAICHNIPPSLRPSTLLDDNSYLFLGIILSRLQSMRNRKPYHVYYYMLWNWLLWTATSTKAAISGVIPVTRIIPVKHIFAITPLALFPREETTYDHLVTTDFYWCVLF
uniref:Uncharacterized protein n=1 Tax=Pseudocercospora mori TaxID=1341201 RepID=A0A2L1K2L3_9PEZI|nr:hypothetical protein [Pseudocercospora mori]AVE15072.1 hypothetical protein [Pseudocercospora mori]